MAIFSRRTIQRLINENDKFLKRRQSKDHARRLNRCDDFFLDTEWEVVLLNAFSKFGKVVHEPELTGTRPDIYFTSDADSNQSFIADIATLSDRGLKLSYPVEAFHEELMKIVHERSLRANSFYLEIETDYRGVFRDGAKPILKLPTLPNFKKVVFNEKFDTFLDEVANAPNERRVYTVRNEHIGVVIAYNPTQRYSLTSHLSYKLITSLIQNTAYNRLAVKAGKLIEANCGHPLGLIVCDGGYSLFNRTKNWDSYGFSDVIEYLLREYPAISFVLTITVEQHFGYGSHNEVKIGLYGGESFDRIGESVLESISKLPEALPIPERDATNAVYLLKASGKTHKGSSFFGGLEVSSNKIKISARAILDLLAGKITQEDFFKINHFVPDDSESPYRGNPFRMQAEDGCLIEGIEFQAGENEKDDDWLVFRFGDADAAIAPFTVPQK